jgi:hypothetical protein
MSFQLTEIAVNAIISAIQANIVSELAAVNTARGDGKTNLPAPQAYFFFESELNYRKPAVFVIAEGLDTTLDRGANHMNVFHDITVTVVIEDSIERDLTLACWRYQVALMHILHLTQLSDPSGVQSKMIVKVVGAKYSPIYTEDANKGSAAAVFCKEVQINLRVEHYEPL